MGTARKLGDVCQTLDSRITREDLAQSLNNPENAQQLNGLVEDIRYALMEYQVCFPERFTIIASNTYLRLLYNKKSTTRAVS